jgi:pimeloyl-ACP methyl ester carboxylesterase
VTDLVDAGDGLVASASGDGDGDAILWFHGYTMDASVFDELWRALPGRRHVGLDLPGHGRSRPLRADDDLATLARTVADFARRTGIRQLVGLSFGTLLATHVAAVAPDDVASLVLAAPGLAGAAHDPLVERRYIELAMLYHRRGAGPHMTELWMRSPPDIFRHAVARAPLAARLRAVIDRHRWLELESFAMRDLVAPVQDHALLARIRARTLVLIGDSELDAHRACARLIGEAVPDCAVEVLPDAGHLALLETPAAAAARIAEHVTS